MLTTSSTRFLPPQHCECKLNVGSHDTRCVRLHRYRWWFNLPTDSSYPTLPWVCVCICVREFCNESVCVCEGESSVLRECVCVCVRGFCIACVCVCVCVCE